MNTVEQRFAQAITRGGDISFDIFVSTRRSKKRIMMDHFGVLRSMLGILPLEENGFDAFQQTGIHHIIGIHYRTFYLEASYDQSMDNGSSGQLYDPSIRALATKAGLICPPHEIAFLIADQQPRIRNHIKHEATTNHLNVVDAYAGVQGIGESSVVSIMNRWNTVSKKWELFMPPAHRTDSFVMSGKTDCYHLFIQNHHM